MRNARNGAGQGWCFCSVDVACSACGVRNMVGTGSRLVARSAPAIRNTTGRRNRFGVADLLCSICSICSAVFGGERQVTTPGVAESLREVAPDRRLLALDADLGGRHAEGLQVLGEPPGIDRSAVPVPPRSFVECSELLEELGGGHPVGVADH